MSFPDAVSRGLAQYAVFSGRARRSEFWWLALFCYAVLIAASLLHLALDTVRVLNLLPGLVGLAVLLPFLGVSIRRLHDTGRSGWYLLIGLVPLVGGILLLLWYVGDSAPANRYGPTPT